MKPTLFLRTAVVASTLAGMVVITPISPQAATTGPEVPMAGIWYVAPGGSDANDCTTPATPCASITTPQSKPSFADGDTIRVAIGTYTTDKSYGVVLSREVTVSGGWNPGFTAQTDFSVIDGENTRRGLQVNWGVRATSVDRFVIRNAAAGGIAAGGPLTLTHSIVIDNRSTDSGGGISIGSSLTMVDCAVIGNRSAGSGGGISVGSSDGSLTMIASSVTSNSAALHGGGIASSGPLRLTNSTISDNLAAGFGGAIFLSGGSNSAVQVDSATVAGNNAQISGGGIYVLRDAAVTLRNSILAGNAAPSSPDCRGPISSAGYSLVGSIAACGFAPGTGDLTNIDPRLGHLVGVPDQPWYYPLLAGSPAIDAGTPAGCTSGGSLLPADQRGATRAGRCDIGAYEYTLPGPAAGIYPVGGTPQRTPPLSAFSAPLQAAVLDSLGSPVQGGSVTFTAPQSGPSTTFEGASSYTVTTDEGGVATAIGQANAISGSYSVAATASGLAAPATFALGNFAWYVAPSGSDANDCVSPVTPCATIGGPLAKAGFVAGDEVRVANGTYTGTGGQVLWLKKDAVLSGGWDVGFAVRAGSTILDGEGARAQGISVDSGVKAVIERFTVRGAKYHGIQNEGLLTLASSAVISNTTAHGGCSLGGGIANWGTMLLEKSVVNYNEADCSAGGILNGNWQGKAAIMIINDSTVSGNMLVNGNSGGGGGISNLEKGILLLFHSKISGNVAFGPGGGISNRGTLILIGSTVSYNTSDREGGGIGNATELIMENSTVSGNTAGSSGGGISNGSSAKAYLYNTTVAGNMAPTGGGVSATGLGTITAQNALIAGNSGGDCAGTLTSAGYNLLGLTAGCPFTPAAGDQVDVDPKLGPLQGLPGWHPLLADSPAIDAGNPAGCTGWGDQLLRTDQRGFPRFGRCDIGAYESGEVFWSYLPMVRR